MIPSVKKSTKSFDMERQEINEVIGHVPGEHDALAAGTSSDVLAAAQATNSFPRCPPRRTTSTTAGGTAGEAIGLLGGRQDAGRGASSESVMLARHVSNNFVDFLPLHIKWLCWFLDAGYHVTSFISCRCITYDFVDFLLRTIKT